jgi:formamidase
MATFVGVIGVAPSAALRETIQRREANLLGRGGMVLPPEKDGAVPAAEPIASEALRTIPPRENGGNLDIKQLSKGARLMLPVFADGALFSVGDAHFAQGDGEACGTAIEMAGAILVRFTLHKGEAARRGIRFPRFARDDYYFPPELAAPKRFLATTGLSIREDGTNESEDATLSARNALLAMIDLLVERGWTRQQAYAICSVAVDLKLSELVDVPNFVVSAFLPLDIFGQQKDPQWISPTAPSTLPSAPNSATGSKQIFRRKFASTMPPTSASRPTARRSKSALRGRRQCTPPAGSGSPGPRYTAAAEPALWSR